MSVGKTLPKGYRRVIRALNRRARINKLTASFNQRFNRCATRKICNSMIRVPVIGGIQCEESEPWFLQLLTLLLPYNKGSFVDVGANLGQTMIKVKALDSARKYIGFEPNPTCAF